MFGFFIENDPVSQHQFDVKSWDPWINQLLSITGNREQYLIYINVFDVYKCIWYI